MHNLNKILDEFKNSFQENSDDLNTETLSLNGNVKDILDSFYTNIKEFKIDSKEKELTPELKTEKVLKSIEAYTGLRNQYIHFLEILMKFNLKELDTSFFIDFIVNLELLSNTRTSGIKIYECYNFTFFLKELFLYTLVVPLNYKEYDFVSDILYSPYYLKKREDKAYNFTYLDTHNRVDLDNLLKQYYLINFNENLNSPIAKLLVKRVPSNYEKDNLVDADVLCCYITKMHKEYFDKGYSHGWFPLTYVYKENSYFDLIRKLSSKQHFEKTKCLFKVDTVEELKDLINKANVELNNYGYLNPFDILPTLDKYVNIEEIGTLR